MIDGLARSPLIETAFDRLERLWPHEAGDPVLNRGDAVRIAHRQAHFGEVAVAADPDTLILHHDSLRAVVQGSHGD